MLLSSRTRVGPIKSQTQTIPRLERCRALLLARLISAIRNFMQFAKLKTYYEGQSGRFSISWAFCFQTGWKLFVVAWPDLVKSNGRILSSCGKRQ